MGKIKDETLKLDIIVNGNKAQKALGELENSNRKLKESSEDLRKSKQLLLSQNKKGGEEWKKVTKQITENNAKVKENKTKMSGLRKEIGLSALTSKQLYQEQRKLKNALSNTVKSLHPEAYAKYEKQLGEVNNELNKLKTNGKNTGGIIGKMKSQMGGLGGIVAGAFSAGAVIQFGKEVADSVAELRKTKSTLQQITGLKGLALKKATVGIKALADTYGKETKEMTIATHNFAQGMEIDFDQAQQLVKQGFLDGADANEEFLDKLREYPVLLKEAGFSAEESVALMTQEVKTGIYSDKGVDSIKEANLRLREMTPATKEALEMIGLSSETVQKELRNGSKTTFDIMQQVSKKLSELPPQSAEVGTAIADIFGGPGEDAGLKYLANLQNIDLTTGALTASTNDYLEAQKLEIAANEAMNLVWIKLTGTGSSISTLYSKLRLAAAELLGGQKSLTETFDNQADYVLNLNNKLIPLTDEYDKLKGKTELSKDEQIRLETVIGKIAKITPTAITAFDEYGNAMDISSGKARDFIETQKALLSFNNKEAIEENTESLKGYQKQIKKFDGQLKMFDEDGDLYRIEKFFDATTKKTTKFKIKLTAAEITLRQAKLAELQKLEAGALESIDQLSGDYLNKHTEKQKNLTATTLAESKKRADALGVQYSDEATASEINALIVKQQQIDAAKNAAQKLSAEEKKKLYEQNKKKLATLEDKYEKEKLTRLATSKEAKAQLLRDEAITEATALGAKKELLDAIEAEHKIKIDEARTEDEQIELQKIIDFETQKTELENEIALAKKETELEKELLKAEQDVEKQVLALENMKLTEEQKTQLALLLEESKQAKLLKIKNKYQKITDKKEIELAKDRKKLQADILNGAIDLAGRESKIGQALLAVKGVLAAKETLIQLGLLKTKVAAKAAESGVDVAAGFAKTLSAGFPQNIPLLIGFAAQAAGIISAITGAVGASKKIKGYEGGKYQFTRTDGKRFNASINNSSHTQMVTEPTYFSDGDYLAGEAGPEIIIDTPTLRNLDPGVIDKIYASAARTRGFESGLYKNNETTESESSEVVNNEYLIQVLNLIAERLSEPLIATALIGDSEIEKLKIRTQKLTQNRQNAKIS